MGHGCLGNLGLLRLHGRLLWVGSLGDCECLAHFGSLIIFECLDEDGSLNQPECLIGIGSFAYSGLLAPHDSLMNLGFLQELWLARAS